MMKKLFLVVVLFCVVACGCTSNQRAKSFGGKSTTKLPAGQKLVNVTWKDSNLWILTRPMKEGEKPETYSFKEESGLGLVEGTVTIEEVAEKE